MRDQPTTKLGRAVSGVQRPAEESKFARAIAGARVLHPFKIPRLGLDAVMTLVPHNRGQAIDAAVHEEMRRLKLEPSPTTDKNFESEKAVRMIAEAVLDPESVAAGQFAPLGALSDWNDVDDDVIADVWRLYLDLRYAVDPIEEGITREDEEIIFEALKKNSAQLLRFCGVRRLSSFMLSMAPRLLPSVPPTSTPSGSEPASSS